VAIRVRFGVISEIDTALAVYERSNLARREGAWPNRKARVREVRTHLQAPESWLLVASDGDEIVGMASATASRSDDGAGPVIPGGCFLSYLYVVPERWGEGIGGAILDAVLDHARRLRYSRILLWTHEDNERSKRLYRRRGFLPTGRAKSGREEWQATV
jgi:RimJ/RimL family protein N-acetyltransferase